MNLKSFVCILAISVISCSPKKETSTTTATTAIDTIQNKVSEEQVNSPKKSSIQDLSNFVGKKATEVKLFEMIDLNKRFEKLLGEQYSEFKSDWNQETPIMKDGEILFFIGCKANACSENKFFVMVDLVTDNINVIHMKNGRPVSHEESAVIGMTDKIAETFEKSRASSGLM